MIILSFQLYQTYGKRTAEDVHKILSHYKTSYIIMEDSICLAPSNNGCRVPDLIDVDNGVVRVLFLANMTFGQHQLLKGSLYWVWREDLSEQIISKSQFFLHRNFA